MNRLLALDTETTGIDFIHGARPFLVTTCMQEEGNVFWEWAVDGQTRMPEIPSDDIESIKSLILNPNYTLVLQNSRFDCTAISSLLSDDIDTSWWPWDRTEDTLVAAHVLASSLPKSLDVLALQYLGYTKMELYEKRVEVACKAARAHCRRFFRDWRIAKHGDPMMPSIKKNPAKGKDGKERDSGWKSDMWLLNALLSEKHTEASQSIFNTISKDWRGTTGDGLCAEYANLDSDITLRLWPVMKAELLRRGLFDHYKERMKLLPIALRMEQNKVTINRHKCEELKAKFSTRVSVAKETCIKIAERLGYPLRLAAGAAVNNNLKHFIFGEAIVYCSFCKKNRIPVERDELARHQGAPINCPSCKKRTENPRVDEWEWLGLPVEERTDSGAPSLSSNSIEKWFNSDVPENAKTFLRSLKDIRSGAKAIEALHGYESFWLPVPNQEDWYYLRPNLNPVGTSTLRWSSKDPNLQNISKKEDSNLRYVFGPAPGREAWSMDFKNIELRIPAFESGQKELIALFEAPDEPPFYGSQHLLNFSVIYPEIWAKALPHQMDNRDYVKNTYKTTYYQWIKNTGFALKYECGDEKADKTAHAKGVKKALSGSFPYEAAMKRYWISFANKHGYVETLPRKNVCPQRGYPLMLIRSERGTVKPTEPMAYHVSGTAMDLTAIAMIRCQEQLDVWNKEAGIPDHYRISLQLHDELIFDFPQGSDPRKRLGKSNLSRARTLQKIMGDCGKEFICKRRHSDQSTVIIPTPVSVEYHPVSWGEGIAI